MTSFKALTTQALNRFSPWLVKTLGFGPDFAQPPATGNTWNAEMLVNFGLEMGKGFGSGMSTVDSHLHGNDGLTDRQNSEFTNLGCPLFGLLTVNLSGPIGEVRR